jgi:hypothetical protein
MGYLILKFSQPTGTPKPNAEPANKTAANLQISLRVPAHQENPLQSATTKSHEKDNCTACHQSSARAYGTRVEGFPNPRSRHRNYAHLCRTPSKSCPKNCHTTKHHRKPKLSLSLRCSVRWQNLRPTLSLRQARWR